MKSEETKAAVKFLGGLFPGQVTQEQAKFLRGELAAFERAEVWAAIKAHRSAHGFLEIPQLIEGCRAASKRGTLKPTNPSDAYGTWFDVRWQQNPQLNGKCDAEVAMRVYRAHWHKCVQNEAYAKQFARECAQQLYAAGMETAQAAEWAKSIFEAPDYFQRCLDDLRRDPPKPRALDEANTNEASRKAAELFGTSRRLLKAPESSPAATPQQALEALAQAELDAIAAREQAAEQAEPAEASA